MHPEIIKKLSRETFNGLRTRLKQHYEPKATVSYRNLEYEYFDSDANLMSENDADDNPDLIAVLVSADLHIVWRRGLKRKHKCINLDWALELVGSNQWPYRQYKKDRIKMSLCAVFAENCEVALRNFRTGEAIENKYYCDLMDPDFDQYLDNLAKRIIKILPHITAYSNAE